MALDAYLVIADAEGDVIPGEGTQKISDPFHPGEVFTGPIALSSFTLGTSTAVSLQPGTGAGKTNFQNLVVTRSFDRSSVAVLSNLLTGRELDGAQLVLVDPLTGKVAQEFDFKDVYVDDVATQQAGESNVEETVTFVFGAVQVLYGNQVASWNVISNTSNYDAAGLTSGVPGTQGSSTPPSTTTTTSPVVTTTTTVPSTTTSSPTTTTTTPTGPGTSVPESPLPVALPVAALAAVGGGMVVANRHRGGSPAAAPPEAGTAVPTSEQPAPPAAQPDLGPTEDIKPEG